MKWSLSVAWIFAYRIETWHKNIRHMKNFEKYRNNENIAITQKIWKIVKILKNIGRKGRMMESLTTTHAPGGTPAPLAYLAYLQSSVWSCGWPSPFTTKWSFTSDLIFFPVSVSTRWIYVTQICVSFFLSHFGGVVFLPNSMPLLSYHLSCPTGCLNGSLFLWVGLSCWGNLLSFGWAPQSCCFSK